ncbi:MAG: DUF6876 family protein [Pseudomonadota bacterium]
MKTKKLDTTAAVKSSDRPEASSSTTITKAFAERLSAAIRPEAPRVLISTGLAEITKTCRTTWLIEAIVSAQQSVVMHRANLFDARLASMQFWKLEIDSSGKPRLFCRADSDEEAVYQQSFPSDSTICGSIDIWAQFSRDSQGTPAWALYLPSEH